MIMLSIIGAVAFPLFLGVAIFKVRFRIESMAFLAFILLIFLMAFVRGYPIHSEYNVFFIVSIFAVFSGAVMGASVEKTALSSAKIILYFFVVIFLINVVLGNPFSYRYAEDFNNYQGISRISGVLFAIFVFLALNVKNFILASLYLCFSVAFFIICLSGGGRGELIAALICVAPSILQKGRGLALLPIILVLLLLNLERLLEMRGIVRIVYLLEANSFGIRSTLALDAISLLTSDATTLFFGCGINCFQQSLGYDYALYPHNYVLEALVTFGLIGCFPLLVMMARLTILWISAMKNDEYLIILIAFFFFLVSLKSGSIMSSFSTTFLLFYCSALWGSRRLKWRLHVSKRAKGACI